MNAKSDKSRASTRNGDGGASGRGATRDRANERAGQEVRHEQYLMAPLGRGMNEQQLIRFVHDVAGIDVVRTLSGPGTVCPPVVIASTAPDQIASLRRSAAGTLLIESDQLLRPASLAPRASVRWPIMARAPGPGFTTTIQVVDEEDEPVPHADVQIIGQQWAAQGTTDADGRVEIAMDGELPETVTQLIVEPHAGWWGACRTAPDLEDGATTVVTLRRLSADSMQSGWARQAMGFDRLPPQWRGAGVKIALIDSGVARSHECLTAVAHGFDTDGDDKRPWSEDPSGHGTRCAGIMVAAPETAGLRGYAPESELHVCKLPRIPRCSNLVAALDYCITTGVDIGCLAFVCERGSAIVEHRVTAAKQRGMALIAAAGSGGGAVQFPASSRHVLSVGAVGRNGTFPEDSPQAVYARDATSISGLFVPAFSCRGPELDLCAPGVAIASCQSPEGYAVGDGTSLAAPHVAALAALLLAHHPDFQQEFARRDARRVERLFQVLKETAQPLGDRNSYGAGLPDAIRALGLQTPSNPLHPPLPVSMDELRRAMHQAGLAGENRRSAAEPARGPAIVTDLPLRRRTAPHVQPGIGVDTQMQDLKTAMQFAGLSERMDA